MKSAICPKCFTQSNEEQWEYMCNSQTCGMLDKAVSSDQAVTGKLNTPACPECGEPFASPLCPNCGFPVREDEQGAPSLSLSLVGAQGSGKSHFLSVVIEELRRQVSKAYGFSLFPLGGDETIKLYDDLYYQPLYVHGHALDSTDQNNVNPLIYSLVFQQERGVKPLNLTLYDACGANFESIAAMANLNRSIYHSSGIVFLIDPTQLPVVGEWQASHGGTVCDADAAPLLSRTIHLIRSGNGQKSLRQKIEVPIAVCLTKLDMVKPLLDASSFLRLTSSHHQGAGLDQIDLEACNLEVQSLIEAWGGGEIVRQITSQFAEYKFFALSSLGSGPTDSGAVNHIAPHRVTDPLLWLLWKNKVIK